MMPVNPPEFPVDTKVYSYIRFSTPDQRKGTGQWRQEKQGEAWCDKQGLKLERNYSDLGVSAFRGKNTTAGALSKFLDCVKKKTIKPGSILIVENLDRLSRDEVHVAAEVFLGIINQGVIVVTLCDERLYSKKSIDFSQLIISLAIFARAHDESMIKSQRKGASWKFKRERARQHGAVLGGKTPGWIKIEDGKYVVVEEAAKKVRNIFQDYVNGLGIYLLNKKYNVPKPTISYWLTNPVCLGTVTVTEGERKYEIPNHYPAVIGKSLWNKAQRAKANRYVQRKVTGRTGFVNLFSGILVDHKGERYDVARHYGFSSYVSRNGHVIQARPLELAVLAYKLYNRFVTVEFVAVPETDNPRIRRIDAKVEEIKTALLENDTLAADLLPTLRKLKAQRAEEMTGGATEIEQKVDHSLVRDLLDGEATAEDRLRMREIVRDTVEQVQVLSVTNNTHYAFVTGEIHQSKGRVLPFRYAYGTRREGIVLCDDLIAYERFYEGNLGMLAVAEEEAFFHGIDDNVGVWATELSEEVIEAIKLLPKRPATVHRVVRKPKVAQRQVPHADRHSNTGDHRSKKRVPTTSSGAR